MAPGALLPGFFFGSSPGDVAAPAADDGNGAPAADEEPATGFCNVGGPMRWLDCVLGLELGVDEDEEAPPLGDAKRADDDDEEMEGDAGAGAGLDAFMCSMSAREAPDGGGGAFRGGCEPGGTGAALGFSYRTPPGSGAVVLPSVVPGLLPLLDGVPGVDVPLAPPNFFQMSSSLPTPFVASW